MKRAFVKPKLALTLGGLTHHISVVEQNLQFFPLSANTLTIARRGKPTQDKTTFFSLSAEPQTGDNTESSVKRGSAAKTVILRS